MRTKIEKHTYQSFYDNLCGLNKNEIDTIFGDKEHMDAIEFLNSSLPERNKIWFIFSNRDENRIMSLAIISKLMYNLLPFYLKEEKPEHKGKMESMFMTIDFYFKGHTTYESIMSHCAFSNDIQHNHLKDFSPSVQSLLKIINDIYWDIVCSHYIKYYDRLIKGLLDCTVAMNILNTSLDDMKKLMIEHRIDVVDYYYYDKGNRAGCMKKILPS